VKICDVCRAANEPEAEFCGTCGSRLPVAEPPADETPASTDVESGPESEVAPRSTDATGTAPTSVDDAVTPGAVDRTSSGPQATGPATVIDSGPVTPTPTPPWNTSKAAPPPVEICPVCQTENEVGREFCRKCANPLHPAEVVKPRLITRAFVARFLLSFVIGVAVPVGGAAAVTAFVNQPKELPATPVSLTLQGGEPLEFEITPTAEGASEPITPLPPTSTVQLASYKEAIEATPPGQNIDAKWWNDGVPRVPAVSQFDGGPLQKVNCTMAAGAMLARLAFGIVTTGSQLRSLQDDQDGGTNFDNLNNALERGWGVSFLRGSLTALQLRALSYAGAGLTVSLNYGEIPVGVRLQESFTGGHAVYIDAFTPNGPDGRPAYWVMDPIGHSWAGYKGGWWPAEDVERAALTRNGGWISAAWAFAGGRIPEPRPKLPTEAYPGAEPGQPTVPPIGPPIEDPMPVLPPPVRSDPETGTPPPETPVWPTVDWDQKVFELDPGTSFLRCAVVPAPSYCPIGIIGVVDILGTPAPTTRPLSDGIKYLYADALAPGTYQVIFETPPDTDGSLFLWTGTSGELREATVEEGTVDGKTVQIATIQLDPNIGFSFFTTATGDGYRAVSEVGSMTIKQ
jgi:ribosomal protein L40E